jgi:hypothetical protein
LIDAFNASTALFGTVVDSASLINATRACAALDRTTLAGAVFVDTAQANTNLVGTKINDALHIDTSPASTSLVYTSLIETIPVCTIIAHTSLIRAAFRGTPVVRAARADTVLDWAAFADTIFVSAALASATLEGAHHLFERTRLLGDRVIQAGEHLVLDGANLLQNLPATPLSRAFAATGRAKHLDRRSRVFLTSFHALLTKCTKGLERRVLLIRRSLGSKRRASLDWGRMLQVLAASLGVALAFHDAEALIFHLAYEGVYELGSGALRSFEGELLEQGSLSLCVVLFKATQACLKVFLPGC